MTLADGSFFCLTKERADELDPREGEECDVERLAELAERSEHPLAYERSLGLLARREHSRKQLADKLAQRDYSVHTIQAVLDELESNGSLSDLRFAEEWIESRLRRSPAGGSYLRASLQQRGVPQRTVESAIAAVWEREPELFDSAADRALSRLLRMDRDPHSLRQKLQRRGFSVGEIRAALQNAGVSVDA